MQVVSRGLSARRYKGGMAGRHLRGWIFWTLTRLVNREKQVESLLIALKLSNGAQGSKHLTGGLRCRSTLSQANLRPFNKRHPHVATLQPLATVATELARAGPAPQNQLNLWLWFGATSKRPTSYPVTTVRLAEELGK